ncbi:hypothetical protein [Micromonospora sp. CPCC 205556]
MTNPAASTEADNWHGGFYELPIEIGQGEVDWVVLADPAGNGFCVLTPR